MKAKVIVAGKMPMSKKGGCKDKMATGGMAKKAYADGGAVNKSGKVRGAGCAIKGMRPAKMM